MAILALLKFVVLILLFQHLLIYFCCLLGGEKFILILEYIPDILVFSNHFNSSTTVPLKFVKAPGTLGEV